MFNPTNIVIDAFLKELSAQYTESFGHNDSQLHLLLTNARATLEIIANSNAPYHDMNHTIMVTQVGIEILRGKFLMDGHVDESDWLHFVISLLNHDIGYVRGICKADRSGRYATNANKETMTPLQGATDAALTPYHVDRAQLYISERFAKDSYFDIEVLCANIERTRFPVPTEEDSQANDDMPGLLRAADLIGQLADPHYFRKISSLYAEFRETGAAESMGYKSAADLQAGYPGFFWGVVSPYIEEGVRFLRRTQAGQAWVANLYANVFTEEHEAPCYGPERRHPKDSDASNAGSEETRRVADTTTA